MEAAKVKEIMDIVTIYTILSPRSIKCLFFFASLSISEAVESSLTEVELRKLAASAVPPYAESKLLLMSLIASVVLNMVVDASSAVSIIISTTVFARE